MHIFSRFFNGMDNDDDSSQHDQAYDLPHMMHTVRDDTKHPTVPDAWDESGTGISAVADRRGSIPPNRKRKFPPDTLNDYNVNTQELRVERPYPIESSTPSTKKPSTHQHLRRHSSSTEEEEQERYKTAGYPEEHAIGWTNLMHRQFVEAIYEIGINHASPSVIMEHMTYISNTDATEPSEGDFPSDAQLASAHVTSERVKSHLQKYRKNKTKSKDEFRQEYDRWMQKALTVVGGISAAARTSLVSTPTAVVEMMGEAVGDINKLSSSSKRQDPTKKLLGGDVPAFLTFSVLLEEENAKIVREEGVGQSASKQFQRDTALSDAEASLLMLRNGVGLPTSSHPQPFLPSAMEYTQSLSGARIPLPVLTEEEQQSSLGVSISHVIGLFYSMTHTLIKERRKNQQDRSKASDVPDAQRRQGMDSRQPTPRDSLIHAPRRTSFPADGNGSRPFIAPPPSGAALGRDRIQYDHQGNGSRRLSSIADYSYQRSDSDHRQFPTHYGDSHPNGIGKTYFDGAHGDPSSRARTYADYGK